MKKALAVIAVIIAVAVWWAINRISTNETNESNIPAACQLLGGHWSMWNGWQCY